VNKNNKNKIIKVSTLAKKKIHFIPIDKKYTEKNMFFLIKIEVIE
jgi:hypothetical protein